MTDAPTITAIAPWFGSKRTLAPRIVAELGPHSSYWEPFCGSMAVLLAKPQATMETANDLNGDLVNLARCIQHAVVGPLLYRRLRRTLMCETSFVEAAERCKARGRTPAGPAADLERAADYFLTSWFGRNGVTGTFSYNMGFSRRFTKSGGGPAKRYGGAVESIPAWRRRLRHVTVLNDDGFALLPRIEDAGGVAIYADPPYVEKGARYIHDFDRGDHERLAGELRRFARSRVVVSYYDHPVVRELYRGWTFVDCEMSKSLVNEGMRDRQGVVKAPEVLIINGPSYTDGGLYS